jgi:myo-inositol 2-dehydrogenase/D-chiro-inositol 1-dehydrogenase
MALSGNPPAHTATLATVDGTHGATLPSFFLERYVPSYLREWEAFVAAVQSGGATPAGTRDARAPLLIGLAAWRSVREGRAVAIAEVEAG